MTKIQCTAIVLAKDAGETLERCMSSLTWCEHVLVGDDGSRDDTIAIAKTLHADVIKVRAGRSYAEKRNELLYYAPTDWVLFVDADEVVSEQLAKSISHAIKTQGYSYSGFYLRRMDNFMGRKLLHGETAHTWLVRLADKNAGKWQRSVHETWEISGNIGKLDGELLHYSHPTLEEFLDKINRYTELEVIQRVKNPYLLPLTSYLQLFLFPLAKFIQNYIFRLGFLDGFPGLVMAYMMSLHSLCVRIKVLEKLRT